jgi:hypothetical protein
MNALKSLYLPQFGCGRISRETDLTGYCKGEIRSDSALKRLMAASTSAKSTPYLLAAALAGSFYIWFSHLRTSLPWTDEVITIELVKSGALRHLFDAVILGLDATPPLYTGYGWFVISQVAQGTSPELLLRITNGVLVGATIWILYLSIREFFDRTTSVTAISAFVFLERIQLEFLTLEIRTYALFVLTTALAIYFSLRAIGKPSKAKWACTCIAYCLLVGSHTFGIIYVVSIAACSTAVGIAEGNAKLARNSCLATLPALVMFMAWLPFVRHQAQYGSWISPPNSQFLMDSIHINISNHAVLLALLFIAALAPMIATKGPVSVVLNSDRSQKFGLLIPSSFVASTLAVWIFSKIVFAVFVPRYFFPNIVLHIIWLTLLVYFFFTFLPQSRLKHAVSMASVLIAALSITRPFPAGNRVPCFDPQRNAYLEDSFSDGAPVVALGAMTWFTRLNRLPQAVFVVDDKIPKGLDQGYDFHVNYLTAFAAWLNKPYTITTTEELLAKRDFLVLDDHDGPWLKFVQSEHKLVLTELAKIDTACTLWRVESQ